MSINIPIISDTTTLLESCSVEHKPSSSAEHRLCLPFDEAMKELHILLQPSNEQEQKDLAMFLSQVDELHKPIAGKLSARSVFNFVEHMLKPATPNTKKPKEVIIPEQLQEPTKNIAFEIVNSVINDFDLHNTIISVLRVVQEVSWETKAALVLTTFVLTFGDNGLSLCEESKVSVNEIQMFAKLKDGYKHNLDDNNNLFAILYKLIGSFFEFEILPATFLTSKDPTVKVARTQLIVVIYWIIRIIVAASASHIMKLSSRRNEFEKAISALRELPSRWFMKLKIFGDKEHLKSILILLQDLLKEDDVDIEAYNKIKEIIEQGNYSEEMEVLNALFSSNEGDVYPLYDGTHKRKVAIDDVLKRKPVLLLISGLDISMEGVFILDQMYQESRQIQSRVESQYELVWVPVIDRSTRGSTEQKQKEFEALQSMMCWHTLYHPSMLNQAVIKYIKEVWNFDKKPILVVLDPQGRVTNLNALHMMWIWGGLSFPFSSAREEALWREEIWRLDLLADSIEPLIFHWMEDGRYICLYGGDDMLWIQAFTTKMRNIAKAADIPLEMLYVGKSIMREKVRKNSYTIVTQQLSHVLPDLTLVWYFWERLKSMWHSKMKHGRKVENDPIMQEIVTMMSFDESDQGWALISRGATDEMTKARGETLLTCLDDFDKWKDDVPVKGLVQAIDGYFHKIQLQLHHCTRFILPDTTTVPDNVICAECGRTMVKHIMYRCCTD